MAIGIACSDFSGLGGVEGVAKNWNVVADTVRSQAVMVARCVMASEKKIMDRLADDLRSGKYTLSLAIVATMFDETQHTLRVPIHRARENAGQAALADEEPVPGGPPICHPSGLFAELPIHSSSPPVCQSTSSLIP